MSLEKSLATRLLAGHPDEAAAVLESMSDEAACAVFEGAPVQAGAAVLGRLAPHRAAGLLGRIEESVGRDFVSHLGFEDAADLLRRMDGQARERFIEALEPELARSLATLLDFPEGTAGSLMDPRVLALPTDVTAGEAISLIRREPDNVRYNVYVIDRDHRLVGVLNLRELLVADRNRELGAICRRDVLSIQGSEPAAAVLSHPAWQEAHSLPVTDRHGTYLGAVRYRVWRSLDAAAARKRSERDHATSDALGDLFSAGMAGVMGALTDIVASPTGGQREPD